MNNKILARIVATIMAVMMLGTVSFAASLTGATADVSDATLAEGYAGQDEKTFIAFCTGNQDDVDPTGKVIVALDQISNVPTEFTIDTSKLAETDEYIVVLFGGTAGLTGKAVIEIPEAEEDQPVVNVSTASVFENILNDGTRKIYENVFYAKATTTGAEGKTYGFSVTNPAANSTKEFVSATTINGDAEFEFGILFVGVPADAGLTADAFLR